ncbi:DUF2272 domain-containing protein [Stenotrophomonas rhizophila]|uniref:DUF2272 domain-containing protein n=1 Tax=Stenotrophomonas rhizophila TaxID=216778 RepID=UPI001E3FEBCD|nr:DUF2272 domain-containing protein [Stenotrophomonas rhizophila]MCC7634979.1 DUF2272 domain-containing protein [Stenotrophomonas rhizophila]MCC7664238.1 DUF2272 domain-containing protein [Stenotrophomonas rhizophila]
MRPLLLLACLSPFTALLPATASAAEVCDIPPRFGLSPLAVNIVQTACNEHRLWYRPFIDRDGRAASLSATEAEDVDLADSGLVAWQRVVGYWRQSGTLSPLGDQPGASSCLAPPGARYTDSDCRAFLIDTPWSAAFISWVMTRASVPGFTRSPRHIDYIRAAYQNSGPYRMTDPAQEKPAPGDMLCYLRDRRQALSYSGLVQSLGSGAVAHWKSHCEVVIAANIGGDRTLYLIGGNVMNTVAMRKLSLDRSGRIELPPAKAGAADGMELGCTPGREEECSFNRQDWAALLKLVATAPAALPTVVPNPTPAPYPAPTTQTPASPLPAPRPGAPQPPPTPAPVPATL